MAMLLKFASFGVASACLLAGAGCSGTSSPTAPGGGATAPAVSACATYFTAATYVTAAVPALASPYTVTITYSGGAFNAGTNQLTHNVSYADTRGINFTFVQTTSYSSKNDFIDQVIRSAGAAGRATAGSNTFTDLTASWTQADVGHGIVLSEGFGADNYRIIAAVNSSTSLTLAGAPAAASSNAVTWTVNIIPPLTLSTGTTGTGGTGIPFTIANSYDGQRRLTTSVATSPAGGPNTSTTAYTAWDRFGRPTAGTITSGVALAVVYDDAARSMTTTATSPGLVSVATQTFDTDGLPANYIARESNGSVTAITTTVAGTAKLCR